MNDERSFERFVADNVAGAAGSVRLPDDFYDDIHAFASRTRQRPEWLALIKEPPMRIDSTLGVGSPTARVAILVATTLLMALLGVGALVAGAQSPSPAPPEVVTLSFFSGTQAEAPGVRASSRTRRARSSVASTQARGTSWGCQTVTTDDPRFSGETTYIWNTDAVNSPGGSGEISAVRQRIENEAGAWEGTLTELQVGSEFHESAGWLVGEGAYDGLAAYVMTDADNNKIWGVIRPDDGFAAPTAFAGRVTFAELSFSRTSRTSVGHPAQRR